MSSKALHALRISSLGQMPYVQETYLLSLSSRREEVSYSVRVEFKQSKPNVIYVKKLSSGTSKVQVLLDILCLHRYIQHNCVIRMAHARAIAL